MRFFDNSTINRAYVHSALQTFAENAGGVFAFVYLLKSGFTVPFMFCTLAVIFFLRIGLRQAVLPMVLWLGLRGGLIVGTLLTAGAYLFLAGVHGVGLVLALYVALQSFGTSIYWTCYHSYVAKLGDTEHRGAQVSAREAINAIMSIAAPLCGSFLLIYVGSIYAFAVAALIEALAVVPLLSAPNYRIAKHAAIAPRQKWYAQRLFFTDGLITSAFNFSWSIALFKTLGENFGSYGGTLALAGVIGAAMSLFVGRLIDLGHHKRTVQIAYAAITIAIMIRAFGFTAPWSAIAANALGAVAAPLYMPVLISQLYNIAKASACPLRFQVAVEGAWDLGTGMGCLLAALLTWLGFSYFWPLILGLTGCFAGYALMQNKTYQ